MKVGRCCCLDPCGNGYSYATWLDDFSSDTSSSYEVWNYFSIASGVASATDISNNNPRFTKYFNIPEVPAEIVSQIDFSLSDYGNTNLRLSLGGEVMRFVDGQYLIRGSSGIEDTAAAQFGTGTMLLRATDAGSGNVDMDFEVYQGVTLEVSHSFTTTWSNLMVLSPVGGFYCGRTVTFFAEQTITTGADIDVDDFSVDWTE